MVRNLKTPRQSGDIDVSGTLSAADLTTHANLGIWDIDDAIESLIGVTTYVDVHTDVNPDGEVRGVLQPSVYHFPAAGGPAHVARAGAAPPVS